MAGTSAWADIHFQGNTTGVFDPSDPLSPLTFTGGNFDITMPPSTGFLSNLGTFEIDKSNLSFSGNNCLVENWDPGLVTFTLTLNFTLPTVSGTQQFSAPVSGTIKKDGNSSNFTVDDVTFEFDNIPKTFTFVDSNQSGSFDLMVFDPAAMDLTLNPSHSSVTTTVTGQISNVSIVPVPETSSLAILTLNLIALPGLLFLKRRWNR